MLAADAEDHAITEAMVQELEVNDEARVDAIANAVAYRVTEGTAAVFELLGVLTRR